MYILLCGGGKIKCVCLECDDLVLVRMSIYGVVVLHCIPFSTILICYSRFFGFRKLTSRIVLTYLFHRFS